MLSLLTTVVPYFATAAFLFGMAWRTCSWLRRPVLFALTIDTTRTSASDRALAIGRELSLFPSLFKTDPQLWLWAWLLHLSLVLLLLGHAVGIASLAHQFTWFGFSAEASARLSLVAGEAIGVVFVASACALLIRRIAVPVVRRLSTPAEYVDLLLLLAIALTGMAMRADTSHEALVAVRRYLAGLLTLRPVPAPAEPWFLAHLLVFNVLLAYLPFSKLVHLTGAFVSRALLVQPLPMYPTRTRARTPAGLPWRNGRTRLRHIPEAEIPNSESMIPNASECPTPKSPKETVLRTGE